MPKYFFKPNQLCGGDITLTGEAAHHLIHVLRMTEGNSVTMCNGVNTDYTCIISAITKRGKEHALTLAVQSSSPCENELPAHIVLYQSLPKGDKLDLIIQKCTELGVTEIIPVATARSVAKLKDATKKVERYQRIAESAAGQSMRGVVPVVHPATSFAEAVNAMSGHAIVAYEEEKICTLQASINSQKHSKVNVWIGPEGGWAKEEIETLTSHGATAISLGRRILRTETAAIATIAQLSMFLEV